MKILCIASVYEGKFRDLLHYSDIRQNIENFTKGTLIRNYQAIKLSNEATNDLRNLQSIDSESQNFS